MQLQLDGYLYYIDVYLPAEHHRLGKFETDFYFIFQASLPYFMRRQMFANDTDGETLLYNYTYYLTIIVFE